MSSRKEALSKAREAREAGDAREAFSHLRGLLEYPGDVGDDARWTETLEAFAPIAAALDFGELAERTRAAAAAPDDPQAVFDLGYELLEVGLSGVAATALARADRLAPGDPNVIAELAAALEASLRSRDACELLQKNRALVDETFMLVYLLAFNSVMIGDLDEARRLLPAMRRLAGPDDDWAVPRVEGYLSRADAARGSTPLDEADLRGWHFVLTGGLLLHVSPYGHEEGMGGRYAFVQDSEAICLEGIRRVAAALRALGQEPARVLACPDRSSTILAHATAAALALPVEPWPSEKPGLIVAYDLASCEETESLSEHRDGQILWAHASCWTELQPVAADLVTFLYQYNTAPWDAQLRVDPATQEMRRSTVVEGSPAEIGRGLADGPLEADALANLPALVALALAVSPSAAAHRTTGKRERQFPGSPVPSSRFY